MDMASAALLPGQYATSIRLEQFTPGQWRVYGYANVMFANWLAGSSVAFMDFCFWTL